MAARWLHIICVNENGVDLEPAGGRICGSSSAARRWSSQLLLPRRMSSGGQLQDIQQGRLVIGSNAVDTGTRFDPVGVQLTPGWAVQPPPASRGSCRRHYVSDSESGRRRRKRFRAKTRHRSGVQPEPFTFDAHRRRVVFRGRHASLSKSALGQH